MKIYPDTITEILDHKFSFLNQFRIKNYIVEKKDGKIHTTTKGSICADLGVSIETFEQLIEWLYSLFLKKPSIKQLLYDCLKKSTINNVNDVVFDSSYFQPIYEHIVLGHELAEVVQKHHIYEGDLLRLESNIKSLVSAIVPLSDYLGLKCLNKNLSNLDLILTEVFKLSN